MSPEPDRVSRVAAVVLAAGESRRFGSPKQLAQLDGRTLLEHVLVLAMRAGLDPILAVVPVWLAPPTHAVGNVQWVRNLHSERGMSFSLQLGFEALPAEADAAVILLGDQPTLPAATIETVLAGRGERPITAASADGRPAPPVCIERSHFGVVAEATGDQGLRDLLLAHPDWVAAVEVGGHPPDIDTLVDLRRVRTNR